MRGRPGSRDVWKSARYRVDAFIAATPARFAIVVFAGLVLIFTLLFSLPAATAGGERASLVDALFTAVSVICVTGLSTVDMATYWSPFGNLLVFLGVQIGGVGVLTMASILGLVISRRLGLRQKLIAAGDSNPLRIHRGPIAEGQAVRLGETGGLLLTVAISMLTIEAVIAVLLFPRILIEGVPILEAAWQSVYISAMAFTNTGFLPLESGLADYSGDVWFLSALMIAVVAGAIGFPVIFVLSRNLVRPRRWSLHVKLTLVTFAVLLVGGAAVVLSCSSSTTRRPSRTWMSVSASCRASSSRRWPAPAASPPSTCRNSTARACSSPTCSCSSAAAPPRRPAASRSRRSPCSSSRRFAEARGQEDMEAYERTIPSDVLRLGVSVVLWGATTVLAASVILLLITDASLDHVLFDVISAFATCGLSTGFTADYLGAGAVRARSDYVLRTDRHRDPRRRARGEPAPTAVQTTGREAHRWLTGSRTTHPSW